MAAAASAGRVQLRVHAQLRHCYRSGSPRPRYHSVMAVALPAAVTSTARPESRTALGPAAAASGTPPRLGDPLGAARAAAHCRTGVACGAVKSKKGGSRKNASDYQDYTEAGGQHPDLPWPRNYQQTLRTSFSVSGIGLHTGEKVCVRVRPAFAGEGRYFVRVPDGTNSMLADPKDDSWISVADAAKGEELSPAEEERRTQLFIAYLNAQQPETDEVEPFEGTFEDYTAFVAKEPTFAVEDEDESPPDTPTPEEEIIPRSEDDDYVLASLDNATDKYRLCTTIESGKHRFITVEHLLSALEGCSIDNARIEVEGGQEMPVIDGSSLGWCLQIQTKGVRPAPSMDGETKAVEKMVLMPKQVVSVTDGDKFITLYPGEPQERLTYGIDFSGDSPVIGKQWFTWARREDDHYTIAVAPARTFAPSLEAVEEMVANGYIRGGTHDVALVGDGKHWVDETLVRYPIDEQARHKMLDLIGDLSVMAQGGNQALPYGHIVAYKAGHSLHLKFARALRAACDSPDDWRPALPSNLSLVRELIESADSAKDKGGDKES